MTRGTGKKGFVELVLQLESRGNFRRRGIIKSVAISAHWSDLPEVLAATQVFLNGAATDNDASEKHGASGNTAMTDQFQVFLSHNSDDKPVVRKLGNALKKRGIAVWLDEWALRPGVPWMDAIEDIITTCGSAAVCVGGYGIGPWEEPEMQALLRRFVKEKASGNILPVIPILLPGAPEEVKLPVFLEGYTWVDMRAGLRKKLLDRVQWGITGKNPN
jgi:hypothetical protein